MVLFAFIFNIYLALTGRHALHSMCIGAILHQNTDIALFLFSRTGTSCDSHKHCQPKQINKLFHIRIISLLNRTAKEQKAGEIYKYFGN